MNNIKFKIPDIASGKVIPPYIAIKQMKEEKEAENQKRQFQHEWKLAFFNTFGGALAGLITSIMFWLITK